MARTRTENLGPSYLEALVLFAISESGTCKADLSTKLMDHMTMGDLGKRVQRLAAKGFVQLAGMQRDRHAPPSRIVVLTNRGRQVRDELRRKGVR